MGRRERGQGRLDVVERRPALRREGPHRSSTRRSGGAQTRQVVALRAVRRTPARTDRVLRPRRAVQPRGAHRARAGQRRDLRVRDVDVRVRKQDERDRRRGTSRRTCDRCGISSRSTSGPSMAGGEETDPEEDRTGGRGRDPEKKRRRSLSARCGAFDAETPAPASLSPSDRADTSSATGPGGTRRRRRWRDAVARRHRTVSHGIARLRRSLPSRRLRPRQLLRRFNRREVAHSCRRETRGGGRPTASAAYEEGEGEVVVTWEGFIVDGGSNGGSVDQLDVCLIS